MEYSTALASAGVSTSTLLVLGVLYKVWKAVKGRRLISDCCGKKFEAGIDVRDMPPTPPDPARRQSHSLTVSVPKEECVESPSECPLEVSEHHPEPRKVKSVRKHLSQPEKEEECAPEWLVPTTVAPTKSAEETESSPKSSVPPILLG